ncbi:hypothetical protein BCR36DRAFT_587798 [Piromyces finnis]|uniref:Transglutaminase-like domain-containing protein n=1 Tax=Piromyces finnis TaxID=1754191 RepID=A0A1Y1UUY9_9FUNG|nr:hypothetical protein BCR36DRAFT_587798 [Piromyces finnis]|eukprot:ORX41774.1 hypothetical protein BCR36DRAFT_587798 [Piromyces finnis]
MKFFNHFIILSGFVFYTIFSYSITYNTTIQKRENDQQSSLYYYYNQLHSYEKIIYDKLKEQLEEGLETGHPLYDFTISNVELNDANDASHAGLRVTSAFVMDNPKYFWVGRGNQQSITTLDNVIQKIKISFKRSYEEEELVGMLDKVNKNISGLIENVKKQPSTCHKLQQIHDYLIKNVVYQNGEEYSLYNLYGALVEHASVCEGYAEAFTYICQLVGIPSVIVSSKTHEWNLVQMEDGLWYAMDVTYDDPKINGMEFKSGNDNNKKYDYFLIGKNSQISKNNFNILYSQSEEHRILDYLVVEDSTDFTFPEVAEEAYNCPIEKNTNYIYDYYIPNKMIYIYILIGFLAFVVVFIIVLCIRSRSNDEKRKQSQIRTPVFSA